MANEHSSRVKINVRGTSFEIENDILLKFPLSKLTRMCQQEPRSDGEVVFVNRDPSIFNSILNFYVTGRLHFPSNLCSDFIKEEMAYWEMGLDDRVDRDCWEHVHKTEDETSTPIEWKKNEDSPWPIDSRRRMWHRFFEFPNSSWPALIWGAIVYIHIIMSVVAQLLYHKPEFMVYKMVNGTDEGFIKGSAVSRLNVVIWLDYWSLAVLLFDYVIRLVLAKRKISFLFRALNVIDFFALTFYFLAIILAALHFLFLETTLLVALRIVGALSTVRVLRLLRLVRVCRTMELILRSVWASVIELLIFAILTTVCTVLYGVLVYYAESSVVASHFASPLEGMWYAVVTLTTVGYGDSRPLGPYGKVVGSLCAVTGCLLFAPPIATLVYNYNKLRSQLSATMRTEKRREQSRVTYLEGNSEVHLTKPL